MTSEHQFADAFRVVALRLEERIERAGRSFPIDANDLLETLLSIADGLDPPVTESEPVESCEPPY